MTARTRRPNTVAAGTVSSQIRKLYTLSLLPSTVTCFTLGTASLRTSRRFWLNSNPYRVVPVTLPPGRKALDDSVAHEVTSGGDHDRDCVRGALCRDSRWRRDRYDDIGCELYEIGGER